LAKWPKFYFSLTKSQLKFEEAWQSLNSDINFLVSQNYHYFDTHLNERYFFKKNCETS
jgi:hypothetical protein